MILKYGIRNGKGETVVYIKDNIEASDESQGSDSPIFFQYTGNGFKKYFGKKILSNKETAFMYLTTDDSKILKIYKEA